MNGRDMSFFSSCGEREKRASRQISEPTLAVVHIIKKEISQEGETAERRGGAKDHEAGGVAVGGGW